MANTATVYARIDPELKADVDNILDELGVTPSSLVQMLYSQIKLTKSIPFEIKVPIEKPLFVSEMTKSQFDSELQKGLECFDNGQVYSANEIEALLVEDSTK